MAQAVTLPLRTVGVIFFSGIAGSAVYSNTQVVTGIISEMLRVTADRIGGGTSSRTGVLVSEDGSPHALAINAIADQVRALTAEVQRGSTGRMPSVTLYSGGSGGRVPWVLVSLTALSGAYLLRHTLFKMLRVALLLGKDTFWVSPDKLAEIRQALQSQLHRLEISFRDFSGSISENVRGLSERLDHSIEHLSTKMAEENEVTRKEVNRVGSDVEIVQEAIDEISAQMETLNHATEFSKQGITLLCTIVSNSMSRDAPSFDELQDFVASSKKHSSGAIQGGATKPHAKEMRGYQTRRLGHGLAQPESGLREFNAWKEGPDSGSPKVGVRFSTVSGQAGNIGIRK